MKSFIGYLTLFSISVGLSTLAEAKKNDPFKIQDVENPFKDYDSMVYCRRDGPLTIKDRRSHCAVFGKMTIPEADDHLMESQQKAKFFATNNPRVCRDMCFESPTCKSFAWRPIDTDLVREKAMTCKIFDGDLNGMGLEIDYTERDSEDGWIYWDRNCGDCVDLKQRKFDYNPALGYQKA